MTIPVIILRRFTPPSHVILPVSLVETLIDAAWEAYAPAFGGSDEAVQDCHDAARAAENVIKRARRGK